MRRGPRRERPDRFHQRPRRPETPAARISARSTSQPAVAVRSARPSLRQLGGQCRHASWSPDRTKLVFANGDPRQPGDRGIRPVRPGLRGHRPFSARRHGGRRPPSAPTARRGRPTARGSPTSTSRWTAAPRSRHQDQTTFVSRVPAVTSRTPATPLRSSSSPPGPRIRRPSTSHQRPVRTRPRNFDIVPQAARRRRYRTHDNVWPPPQSEYQPSISPDGTKICYTLTNAGFNSTAESSSHATTPPGATINVSDNGGGGDYQLHLVARRLQWSPTCTGSSPAAGW